MDEALALAAAVDEKSEHPIALAIVAEAKKRGLAVSEATDFKRIPGISRQSYWDSKADKYVYVRGYGKRNGEN